MDSLLGPAIKLLDSSLRFRLAREAVLAGNVTNADTPGYRRKDLHFDALLGERVAHVTRTDPRHLPSAQGGAEGYRLETGPRGTRPDSNGVDLDQEVLAAHRNAGAFSSQAAVMARLSAMVRTAIGGGR